MSFPARAQLPFLLTLFSLSTVVGLAQGRAFRYETISVGEGLSQSSVWCSLQDSKGFLWFGTADGLNRYDGYVFRVFRNEPDDSTSLRANTVWSLLEDREGIIWIGTHHGVDLYDRKRGGFQHFNVLDSMSRTPITALARTMIEDRRGNVWFGTTDGLAVWNRSTGTLHKFSAVEFPVATTLPIVVLLHEDGDGNIWMSADGYLIRYEPAIKKFVSVEPTSAGGRIHAQASARDNQGVYWFATSGSGIWSFDPAERRWMVFRHHAKNPHSAPDDMFRAVRVDSDGRIWFGGITAGICYLDKSSGKFYSFRPEDARSKNNRYEGVASILRDRSGLMWFGYDGGGLIKLNPARNKFHHILLPPSSTRSTGDNFFKALAVDHAGDVWLGTYDQGIAVFNRKTGGVRRFRHDPNDPTSLSSDCVLALLEDTRHDVWIGTLQGLDRFDKPTGLITHVDLSAFAGIDGRGKIVSTLAEGSGEILYCGTATRLLKINASTKHITEILSTEGIHPLSIPVLVTAITPRPDGTCWVGTLGGGLLRLGANGSITQIFQQRGQSRSAISNNSVKTIAIDNSGILWVGTEEGLNRYDAHADVWRAYRTKEGLPNDFIYGILSDERGWLWISTNRGLCRMDASNPEKPNFRNYTPDDGLQSYEFNTNVYFKTKEGEMFFGGVNGFNSFFPDSVTDNPTVPAVVLTGFKKFDEPVDLESDIGSLEGITLKYTESVFSFDFAALEFSNPTRNAYAYRMEGFGNDWVFCGNRREARYTNLDPGTYTFRVRGSNNDGVWNDVGTSIKVVIVPPFWRTWWFIGIASMAGIAATGGTGRYLSTQKLKRRIKELEQERAIQEERQRTRERIARDLHDDLASTVGSAGFFVESAKQQLPSASSQTREFLDKTSSLLTEAEEAMSDLVWSVSPQHDTLASLLLRIRLTTADICKATGMKYEIDIAPDGASRGLSQDVRRNAYLVFKEAIANAARHSGAGLVRVSAKTVDGSFILSICDDGKGIPPQPPGQTKRGHGLRNMKQRAEEIGAKFSIDTFEGKGTSVRLAVRMTQSGH